MSDTMTLPPFALDQAAPGRDLVAGLTVALQRAIEDGHWRPGDRLPPQSELASWAQVSRTVVREAVAALKAEGLVETRQGAGAFVLPSSQRRFSMRPNVERATVEAVLHLLELRLAVEVEAAALAAVRRTDADLAAMRKAIGDMLETRGSGRDAVVPDLAFHTALAAATQNPFFGEFLHNLGEHAFPRRRLLQSPDDAVALGPYYDAVEAEHRKICDAIAARDPILSAAMMRSHLAGSRARYSDLLGQV